MKKGILIKSTGSWFNVRMEEDGTQWQCRLAGKIRLDDLPLTNPIAVGDWLEILPSESEENMGTIMGILPRRNYVVRQSPRKKKMLHILAANVDQALLIVTMVDPMLKPGFIDRFLLTTTPHKIPTVLVFNKADLHDADDEAEFEEFRRIYSHVGLKVLRTSTLSGDGLDELVEVLRGKITLISGQSGVGKSSLVQAIQPHLDLRTGEISDRSGKGTHTTTFAEMFPLTFGGDLIDSPGIKTLSFNNLEPEDIAYNFEEFFRLSQKCRFGASCMHREEPECAVKAGLETGEISAQRYDNYLTILDEVEEQAYWERRNKF